MNFIIEIIDNNTDVIALISLATIVFCACFAFLPEKYSNLFKSKTGGFYIGLIYSVGAAAAIYIWWYWKELALSDSKHEIYGNISDITMASIGVIATLFASIYALKIASVAKRIAEEERDINALARVERFIEESYRASAELERAILKLDYSLKSKLSQLERFAFIYELSKKEASCKKLRKMIAKFFDNELIDSLSERGIAFEYHITDTAKIFSDRFSENGIFNEELISKEKIYIICDEITEDISKEMILSLEHLRSKVQDVLQSYPSRALTFSKDSKKFPELSINSSHTLDQRIGEIIYSISDRSKRAKFFIEYLVFSNAFAISSNNHSPDFKDEFLKAVFEETKSLLSPFGSEITLNSEWSLSKIEFQHSIAGLFAAQALIDRPDSDQDPRAFADGIHYLSLLLNLLSSNDEFKNFLQTISNVTAGSEKGDWINNGIIGCDYLDTTCNLPATYKKVRFFMSEDKYREKLAELFKPYTLTGSKLDNYFCQIAEAVDPSSDDSDIRDRGNALRFRFTNLRRFACEAYILNWIDI